MIYIENDRFCAGITLNGAELRSLKNKASGKEFIWQADPTVWGSSAPILFPIIGNLLDGKTAINGREYAIPKHGVLRGRDAEVVEQGEDYVTFRFRSDAELLEKYPFPFEFLATFRLTENKLEVDYRVTNTGETDIVLSKVTIKGQESAWNGTTTYVLYTKIEGILSANLQHVSTFDQTGSNNVTLDGTEYDLTVVSENLILQSGWTMLFYIVNPPNLIVQACHGYCMP